MSSMSDYAIEMEEAGKWPYNDPGEPTHPEELAESTKPEGERPSDEELKKIVFGQFQSALKTLHMSENYSPAEETLEVALVDLSYLFFGPPPSELEIASGEVLPPKEKENPIVIDDSNLPF